MGKTRKSSRFKNLEGMRFSRLLVLNRDIAYEEQHNRKYKAVYWRCLCDCGTYVTVRAGCLLSGNTTSCGCYHKEKLLAKLTKHGMTRTKTHVAWCNMRSRCLDPRNTAYKHYGGRGIKVCGRWKDSFENFLEDMGECPKNLTLERIDVEGGYCKENCIWASREVQARNRRNNRIIKIGEVEACVATVADFFGLTKKSLYLRMKRHGEDAILDYIRSKYPGDNFDVRLDAWNSKQ